MLDPRRAIVGEDEKEYISTILEIIADRGFPRRFWGTRRARP